MRATDFLKQSDKCIQCAKCMRDCYMYDKHLDESYSPRYFVTIFDKVVSNDIDLLKLQQNLSDCDDCGKCHANCPKDIEVNKVINYIRSITF